MFLMAESKSKLVLKKEFEMYFFCVQIIGNDLLFFGDSSYKNELVSWTQLVVGELVDAIEQESSQVGIYYLYSNFVLFS